MYKDFQEKAKESRSNITWEIGKYAKGAYDAGYKDGIEKSQAEERHKAFSEGYYCGLDDAWKCAKQIVNMTMEDCEEVFGEYRYFGTVVENFTAAGALARLEGYKAKHTDKSCDSCKFEDKAIGEEPCKNCKHSYMDEWQAKR